MSFLTGTLRWSWLETMGTTYTEGSFLWIVNNIFFQYYSLLITVVCILIFILVSYATKQPDYAKIGGLTFSTLTAEDKKASRATWTTKDVLLSLLLIALIIAIYSYFTGWCNWVSKNKSVHYWKPFFAWVQPERQLVIIFLISIL